MTPSTTARARRAAVPALLVAAAVALGACGGTDPERAREARDVVERYERAMDAGRNDRACDLITDEAIDAIGGRESCEGMWPSWRSALEQGRISAIDELDGGRVRVEITGDGSRRIYQLREQGSELLIATSMDQPR